MSGMGVDVAVIGGGLGGVAGALAAARAGFRVVLTEPTDWVGGQLTSQAVPPDEHPWIEQVGCTASYRALRDGIRAYYRRWYPLSEAARAERWLNPGDGRVSRLCHEPRVALAVLEAMLAPYRCTGRLVVLTRHHPVDADVDRDTVRSVTVAGRDGGTVEISFRYVLDATETGEVLPLTGTEYVTGFESVGDTGEPHAPAAAQPLNMQAASVCFAIEHRAGEDHTIDRPAGYEFWRGYRPASWPGPLLSWIAPDPRTLEPVERMFLPNQEHAAEIASDTGDRDLWLFRRIAARRTFRPGFLDSDVTLVNWPMIDYTAGPLFEVEPGEAARHLEGARQLSRSFLYWMQTEAPRADGGTGFPGLRLRADLLGTRDGLAMAPYIRESRRIRARYTVSEQDVSRLVRGDRGAVHHPDSVGVGSYRIDLHPSTAGDTYLDLPGCPFEIPLRALVPLRTTNLLAAAKNAGTTHITNGCFRLHPVEWNIGEAAGLLAAFCLTEQTSPARVASDPDTFAEFEHRLHTAGVENRWPHITGY